MTNHPERRRFFRVTDQVLMRYRLASEVDSQKSVSPEQPSARRLQTLQALNRVEETLSQKMVKLQAENSELAEIFSLLNKKINLLVGEEGESSEVDQEKQALDVNISACGIAFPSPQALAIGSLLVMDITLTLSYATLSLTAQVVGVDPIGPEDGVEGDYSAWIRADFVDISEVDQELLVQHVLKRQSEHLKAVREARERGESST